MTEDEKRSEKISTIVTDLVEPYFNNMILVSNSINRNKIFLKRELSGYSGEEYLRKVEGGGIYPAEWTYNVVSAIASYLCGTGTIRKPLQGNDYLTFYYNNIQTKSHEATECQLNFIRGECSGCDFHSRHFHYMELRDDRATKPMIEYLEKALVFAMRSYFIADITQEIFKEVSYSKKYLGVLPMTSLSQLVETLDLCIQTKGGWIFSKLDHSL